MVIPGLQPLLPAALGGRLAGWSPRSIDVALAISMALHLAILMTHLGTASGLRHASVPGRALTATLSSLRPAPAIDDAVPSEAVPSNAVPEPAAAISQILPGETAVSPRSEALPVDAGKPAVAGGAGEAGAVVAPPPRPIPAEIEEGPPVLPALPARDRSLPQPATLMAPIRFSYPTSLPMQWGQVRVRLLIDEHGNRLESAVVSSMPPAMFDDVAIQIMNHARFIPGYIGKMAVRSHVYFDVSFGPGNLGQRIWPVGGSIAMPSGFPAAG